MSEFAERAFFSFTEVPDPQDHRAYNDWHQLDHRPENLALPGVVGGERWVRTPACAEVGVAVGRLAHLQYLNMYWFAPPADATVQRWEDLAERSFQWGRREDVHIARRLLMGHFRPLTGFVAPRLDLSVAALAFRPTRGVVAVVSEFDEPRSAQAERRYRWWQREYVPTQLARHGVAGCWTFASSSNFSTHADLAADSPPSSTRIALFYLDDESVGVAATFDPLDDAGGIERVLLHAPLESIVPWQWNWFDGAPDARQ